MTSRDGNGARGLGIFSILVGGFETGKPAQALITGFAGVDGAAISPIVIGL